MTLVATSRGAGALSRLWRVIAVTGVAALAGAVALREVGASRRLAPPEYGRLPAFSLTDQDSRPVSLDSLRGVVWVADFVLTRCAGQCPLMSQQMARLAEEFRAWPSVRFVSFSVDPDYDRQEVLAGYAKRYAAAGDRWLFVTGEKAQLWRLCQDGFRLAVGPGEADSPEPLTHSVRLALVDGEGVVRGYYDATDTAQLKRLRADLKRLAHG